MVQYPRCEIGTRNPGSTRLAILAGSVLAWALVLFLPAAPAIAFDQWATGRLGVRWAAEGKGSSPESQLLLREDDSPPPEWVEIDTAHVSVENRLDFGGPWLASRVFRVAPIKLHKLPFLYNYRSSAWLGRA
jgi:hypothetical protein